MKRHVAVVAVCTSLVLSGCTSLGHRRNIALGAPAVAETRNGQRVAGELLAVSPDSVWFDVAGRPQVLALSEVASVRVNRQVYGASYAMARSVLFGAATGVALGVACSSVEDNDLGGCVAGATAVGVGTSSLVGLLTLPSMRKLQYLTVEPPSYEAIRPWVRYPQGIRSGGAR